MVRVLAFGYGVVAYALFFGWFLYAVGFVGNWVVPRSIDSGVEGPFAEALLVNVLLVAVFGIQHTVMARPAFKQRWTLFIPKPIERSTYVLLASLLMWLLIWQWRPMLGVVWDVPHPLGSRALAALSLLGWGIVLLASFMINHFELFGLQQVWYYLRGKEARHTKFKLTGFYKHIRHPLMLAFLVAFWATPRMTVGHLVFAAAFTAYIAVGIAFEERDLLRHFGETYQRYCKEVPMLVPLLKRRHSP